MIQFSFIAYVRLCELQVGRKHLSTHSRASQRLMPTIGVKGWPQKELGCSCSVLLVELTGGDLYSFSFKEKHIKLGVYFL